MYKFVCDRVIPGCTTTLSGDTEEEVRKKAAHHLREHHLLDELDKGFPQQISLGMLMQGH